MLSFTGLRALHGNGKIAEFVDKLGKRDIRVDDLPLALQEAISEMNAQAQCIDSKKASWDDGLTGCHRWFADHWLVGGQMWSILLIEWYEIEPILKSQRTNTQKSKAKAVSKNSIQVSPFILCLETLENRSMVSDVQRCMVAATASETETESWIGISARRYYRSSMSACQQWACDYLVFGLFIVAAQRAQKLTAEQSCTSVGQIIYDYVNYVFLTNFLPFDSIEYRPKKYRTVES